jgi:hypothetical protein
MIDNGLIAGLRQPKRASRLATLTTVHGILDDADKAITYDDSRVYSLPNPYVTLLCRAKFPIAVIFDREEH